MLRCLSEHVATLNLSLCVRTRVKLPSCHSPDDLVRSFSILPPNGEGERTEWDFVWDALDGVHFRHLVQSAWTSRAGPPPPPCKSLFGA